MPTLTERLKAFINPTSVGNIDPDKIHPDAQPTGERDKPKKTQKNVSWVSNLYHDLTFAGRDYPSGNIQDNNYGYAEAYLSVLAVRQAVDYYAQSAQDIPTQIILNTTNDPDKDQIIARSDDVKPNALWYVPSVYHRKAYGISTIAAMLYNAVLYDTIFVEKISNRARKPSNFRVLNSLGVDIRDYTGSIDAFYYSWDDAHVTFQPDEIAYAHGFNPMHDLRGASILQSALSKIQIENNLDRFLQAFFNNNATIGLIGSPPSNTNDPLGELTSLNDEQRTTLKKLVNDWHQGVQNSFRPLITNVPIDWTTLTVPEVEKHYAIADLIEQKIMNAFGINPALVGYTDNTSYKEDLPQIESQFITKRLKPLLSQVETLINDDILPFLTNSTDYRFEFDYTDYQLVTEQDRLTLDLRTEQLNNTAMELNDYIEANGGKRVKELDGYYMVEGVPVPLEQLTELWKYRYLVAPSVYNSELITGEPLPQPAPPDEVIPTEGGGKPVSEGRDVSEPPTDESSDDEDTTKSHDHDHTHDLTYAEYNQAFYQDAPSLDDMFSELVNWKNYVKADKHLKSAFVPDKTRGDIADSITTHTDKSDLLNAINASLDTIRDYQKAIQSTRIEYEIAVEDLIQLARNADIDKRLFKTRMMQSIRGYATLAFIDGLRDGGVFGEPDDNERAQIESHVVSQRGYVNNLADTIYDNGITDKEAQGKPSMWYAKSVSPMYDAGKASADANGIYEWVYGPTEHCKDCLALNGQRHRMKTYYSRGILPQSDRLACNGFNCKCNLVRVAGSARGRLPSI